MGISDTEFDKIIQRISDLNAAHKIVFGPSVQKLFPPAGFVTNQGNYIDPKLIIRSVNLKKLYSESTSEVDYVSYYDESEPDQVLYAILNRGRIADEIAAGYHWFYTYSYPKPRELLTPEGFNLQICTLIGVSNDGYIGVREGKTPKPRDYGPQYVGDLPADFVAITGPVEIQEVLNEIGLPKERGHNMLLVRTENGKYKTVYSTESPGFYDSELLVLKK